jgi:hypothetical protein
VIWLELAVAALGGGIVASILESWGQRLRDYDTARLLIAGEIYGNVISSDHKKKEPIAPLSWVTSAWTAYRDKLSTRLLAVDRDTWLTVGAFYAILTADPVLIQEPLEDEMRDLGEAAAGRLRVLALRRVERFVAYGPVAVFRRDPE